MGDKYIYIYIYTKHSKWVEAYSSKQFFFVGMWSAQRITHECILESFS